MLTQRLGSSTQKNSAFTDSLLEEIIKHPGSCDEVWFATDYGFPPLEKHKESALAVAGSAEKFRKAGIRVSLQLSNSIGHGQYMCRCDCSGLVSPDSKVGKMVGPDGTVADYCFCWNDDYFRNYTYTALKYYIKAIKPYRLWLDDDVRATNHNPVNHGCFCDRCIGLFNSRYGTDYNREQLVMAINEDVETRKKHIEFLRSTLADFVYNLGVAVSEELPGCRLGLQGCANGGYTGFGYEFLYDAMKESTGHTPASRPGGGAYNDYSPRDFINKSTFIAYQNFMLPDYVKDRRPEIESTPDVVFGKSIAGTCFETSCYLASGNTAMSYAIMMNDYESMKWHGEMLAAFSAHRKYWEKLAEVSKKGTQSGLAVFFPKTAYLVKSEKPFDYSKEEIFFAEGLRYCAIPVAFTKKEEKVYVINGRIAKTLSRAEAEYLLTRNVICDGEAVEVLHAEGFIQNLNARKVNVRFLSERFTGHPINKGKEGVTWGGQIWREYDYEIFGENMEPITEYFTPSNGKPAGIASCVFTTSKGAKWAAFGFDLFENTKSCDKRRQILDTCEYLCGERFASELLTPAQACIYPVVDENGKCIAVSLINITVGESGKLSLMVKNPKSTDFTFMGQYVQPIKLKAEPLGSGEYKVEIPSVPAWSAATLFCDD